MDCLEFRRRLGAEPHSRDPGMKAHREQCAACAAAWEQAQAFEQQLAEALEVAVPEGLTERILLAQATGERRGRTRWRRFSLALAASVLLAVAGGGLVWQQLEARSLPALAVAHMPPEIDSLRLTRPLADAAVMAGFAGRGVDLRGPVPADTTYVHDCEVGPYHAVHLVTRADGEPVVVLYLPGHEIKRDRHFRRDGWRGLTMPLGKGTLVLLTNGDSTRPFPKVARAWRQAIEGSPPERLSAIDLEADRALATVTTR